MSNSLTSAICRYSQTAAHSRELEFSPSKRNVEMTVIMWITYILEFLEKYNWTLMGITNTNCITTFYVMKSIYQYSITPIL